MEQQVHLRVHWMSGEMTRFAGTKSEVLLRVSEAIDFGHTVDEIVIVPGKSSTP